MKPKPGDSLADRASADLLAAWRGFIDPEHAHLGPADVKTGVDAEAYWYCPNHPDIPYPREIRKQFKKQVCSYCAPQGRLHPKVNSLAAKCPVLADQWHPTMNGALTPLDVRAYLNERVWWTCTCPNGSDHIWYVSPSNRMQNPLGCPFRSGHRVALSTSIATTHPHIAADWVASKNLPYTAATVSSGSSSPKRRFFWQCQRNKRHQYEATVAERVRGYGCGFCRGYKVDTTNSLAAVRPDVAAEWHPTLNPGLTPMQVTARKGLKVWWLCPKGSKNEPHEWEAVIASRTGKGGVGTGSGCPVCSGLVPTRSTSLGAVNPALAAQWHPTKNGKYTPWEYLPFSDAEVWWSCPTHPTTHEWKATIGNRSVGRGCPHCRLIDSSEQEIRLAHELETVLPLDPDLGTVMFPSGKYWFVDMCFPTLSLIVEYDGAYWHKGNEHRDQGKSTSLASEGWRVVRVRVNPLAMRQTPSRLDVRAHPDEPACLTARNVLEACVDRGWVSKSVLRAYGQPKKVKASDAAEADVKRRKALASSAEREEVLREATLGRRGGKRSGASE